MLLEYGDGPYIFIAEVPGDTEPGVRIVLKVPDAGALGPDPALEVVTPFQDIHDGTREMTVREPDGRLWSLPAPTGRSHVSEADKRSPCQVKAR